MTSRQLHKILGLILLLPLLAWGATGLVFYFKPGYTGAYAQLSPKTYPMASAQSLQANPDWQEIRWFNTLIGQHLLVKINGEVLHLDARTREPFFPPQQEELIALIDDAIASQPERYGKVAQFADMQATTSTGIRINLDWQTMRLSQRGADTDLIDALYNIHYLRWTSIKTLDQILGLAGIALLFGLTALGLQLYLRTRRAKRARGI